MKKKKRGALPGKDARRLYKDLAWTWHIISPPEDYIPESEHYHSLYTTHSKIPVRTLLNLGCGGGHVDWVLKKYYTITGIDISTNMLKQAKDLNPEVEYKRGDMKTVRLHALYDAILLHDSVNYMLTEKDLEAAFRTGYWHLKPGGVMLTFAEEYNTIQQDRVSFSTHTKDSTTITFIEYQHDPDMNDTTFENTFMYLIRKKGRIDIQTDRHLSGIFPLSTWWRLLRAIGFRVRLARCDFATNKWEARIKEFVCVKPT
jgi:SAM-dependent methyltransferase